MNVRVVFHGADVSGAWCAAAERFEGCPMDNEGKVTRTVEDTHHEVR